MSQPSHSEPEYLVSAEKTSNPETRITLNPKTTNLPEFGLRTAGCAESKSHQKKPTQRLPALVVSWLGLARACDCDGAAASGGLGLWEEKNDRERQRDKTTSKQSDGNRCRAGLRR